MQRYVINNINSETTRDGGVSQIPGSTKRGFHFQDLPNEILIKILEMLKYEDLAKSRRVSKFMNGLVKYLLNRGYMVLGNLIEKTKSEIKKELPRRESLRRSHRLSGLSDAYSAVDTRYALLSMTYRKYIDSGVACFIPGKVLDECFRVLGLLKQYYDCGGYFKENINELLRDFRDLSSMAMEHFEEHIQPLLKTPQKNLIGETFILPDEEMLSPCIPFPTTSSTSRSADSDWARTINEKIADHENIIKKQNNTINTLKLAVSQLGSICTQLANKSGVDHNINGILENLYDAMESKSEFVDNYGDNSIMRKRSYHLYNNNSKRRRIQNKSELNED